MDKTRYKKSRPGGASNATPGPNHGDLSQEVRDMAATANIGILPETSSVQTFRKCEASA